MEVASINSGKSAGQGELAGLTDLLIGTIGSMQQQHEQEAGVAPAAAATADQLTASGHSLCGR